MNQPETAPLFGLYGESIQSLEPGYVHIEDVAARSRALDWRIASHRHANLFQVLSIFDGVSDVRFDDDVHTLNRGSVITIPLGVVHAFRFTPGTEGVVLTIADELLNSAGEVTYLGSLVRSPQLIGFEAASEEFLQLRTHMLAIAEEFRRPDTGHGVMLTSLVKIVLTMLVRRLEETRLAVSAGGTDSKILMGFRRLVEQNFTRQWSIDEYASALNTSVSSLNRRCRRYVGLTAKSIVQNRVLLEAKRRLIYTREPVEHIAWSLGFKDPAYFSRFFSRQEGTPPGQYRREATRNAE